MILFCPSDNLDSRKTFGCYLRVQLQHAHEAGFGTEALILSRGLDLSLGGLLVPEGSSTR